MEPESQKPNPQPDVQAGVQVKSQLPEKDLAQEQTPAASAPEKTPDDFSAPDNQPVAQPLISTSTKTAAKPVDKTADKVALKNFFSQWQSWVMIGAGIFGVIGIILGVYGIGAKAAADQEVARLQSELDTANELVVKYMTQLGEKVNELGRPGNVNNDDGDLDELLNGLASTTKEYIYIGEWGIKIKIPEGLKNVSYAFSNVVYPEGEEYTVNNAEALAVSGILDKMDYMPEAYDISRNPNGFGVLVRYPKGEIEKILMSPPQLVYQTEKYDYGYYHPQDVWHTEPEEQADELEIVNLIQEMLSSSDNFSTFKNN